MPSRNFVKKNNHYSSTALMNLVDADCDRKLAEKYLAEPAPHGVDARVDDARHNPHYRENYFTNKHLILRYQ